jgi:D-alanyl-D-alanine carboxypeptidase
MQQRPLRTTMPTASSAILLAFLLGCGVAEEPPHRAASPPHATTAPLHAKPVNVDELDSLIRANVRQRNVVGLSVGVVQDGKVVLARGYGVRSLESRDSVTPATMFAVGSVTKQFTCGAVLLLAQERKLSLQDPVAKYMPQLTRASGITLLDLGQHVSGYRDFYPLDFVDQEMLEPQTADSIIAEYATRPLDFEPGTRWSYSNTGFLILGKVVEKVSGQPFGEFLTQRFFTPLGMSNTRFDPPRGGDRMATGYTSFALSPPIPATPEGAGWAGAAGAIWSTPTDLLAWDLSLLDRKMLTDDSYRTLTTPRRLADGRSSGYGCGETVNDRGDAVVIRHGGAVSGFLAQNTLIPATHSAVVLLTNSDYAPLDELDTAIVRRLVPEADVPEVRGPPALDAARAFLTALQQGRVDRSTLGDDFNLFLTPELVATARKSLGSLGKIGELRVEAAVERGGMEVAILHFKIGQTGAQAYMYRTPDGKIQELLIARE